MIGLLIGEIVASLPGGVVLVLVAGVGYEVHVPLGAEGRFATDDLGRVTVHVHTHAREDALQLFGFASALEKDTFRTLLQLPGVGPKLALAVLGTFSVVELAHAVERADPKPLTRIPGVGKRTAERMLVDLKGKLGSVALEAAAQSPANGRPAAPGAAKGHAALVTDALVRMGFKPGEVDRAVATLPELDRPLGDLVREALGLLAR
ncbi:MAG: Holliday junction branch migration protein RuvA [Myxococcales bacterium]|nr:Holliday junction branch migration protein RuvA [Myxococcales bacterium]